MGPTPRDGEWLAQGGENGDTTCRILRTIVRSQRVSRQKLLGLGYGQLGNANSGDLGCPHEVGFLGEEKVVSWHCRE